MNLIKFHKLSFRLGKCRATLLARFVEGIIFVLYNSRVPCSVRIGRGTSFAYLGIGCVLHKDTVIGESCLIGQGVTIGGRGPHSGVPSIGNNVYLGAGCRVLGPIKIGDNVIVGPNAVVIKDVPSCTIVAGVPAKIIRTGIKDIFKYL